MLRIVAQAFGMIVGVGVRACVLQTVACGELLVSSSGTLHLPSAQHMQHAAVGSLYDARARTTGATEHIRR